VVLSAKVLPELEHLLLRHLACLRVILASVLKREVLMAGAQRAVGGVATERTQPLARAGRGTHAVHSQG